MLPNPQPESSKPHVEVDDGMNINVTLNTKSESPIDAIFGTLAASLLIAQDPEIHSLALRYGELDPDSVTVPLGFIPAGQWIENAAKNYHLPEGILVVILKALAHDGALKIIPHEFTPGKIATLISLVDPCPPDAGGDGDFFKALTRVKADPDVERGRLEIVKHITEQIAQKERERSRTEPSAN